MLNQMVRHSNLFLDFVYFIIKFYSKGLLRLTISNVTPADVGKYSCRIFNDHGEDICHADLSFDTFEPRNRKPHGELYSDNNKKQLDDGIPTPLADRPYITRMTDKRLTLAWKPSVPVSSRYPVTYQVHFNT